MSEPLSIYLASGNAHKVAEFQSMAGASALPVHFISAKSVGGMPAVNEDTGTFVGNAEKKARALQALVGEDQWVLSDDSGLCVDALDGGPGVESAYFAGPEGNSAANLRKLVAVMRPIPEGSRGAHFVCLLYLLGPGGLARVFQGRCEGRLLVEPAGGAGFGYDPLIVPEGQTLSLAELGDDVKNRISHRARAFAALANFLADYQAKKSPR